MQSMGCRIGQFHGEFTLLKQTTVLESLRNFLSIIQSSRGYSGHCQMLHNNIGGDVCVTSCSVRLLDVLSVKQSVNKLLHSALQAHLKNYGDGGLYMGILALQLVIRSLEIQMSRRMLINVYDLVWYDVIAYMESKDCMCRLKLDVSDLSVLNKLTRSILNSKPGCLLSMRDVKYFCGLITEIFLCTFKGETQSSPTHINSCFGTVYYKTLPGQDVKYSMKINGILIDASHIPIYSTKTVIINPIRGKIKTICFGSSLSGDCALLGDVNINTSCGLDVSNVLLEQLITMCHALIQAEVQLVLCQKVIHPRLKTYLKNHMVTVLDKLGLTGIQAAKELTGAALLNNFYSDLNIGSACGYLTVCNHVVLGRCSFINLSNHNTYICTCVLSHRSAEAVNELKVVCETSMDTLRLLLRHPYGLCGAGCWQSHLVVYLIKQFHHHANAWSEQLCCSHAQLTAAVHVMCESMMSTTVLSGAKHDYSLDTHTGHLYFRSKSKCMCGAAAVSLHSPHINCSSIRCELERSTHEKCTPWLSEHIFTEGTEECQVIDMCVPYTAATKSAINTASLLLSVSCCLQTSV